MKTKWDKVPSVCRTGRFFYTSVMAGARFWVHQSPVLGLWLLDGGKMPKPLYFDTSADARKWADKTIASGDYSHA